jgi:hypothetical protein
MGAATIPPPHEDEVWMARTALNTTAERAGLDINDPAVAKFINIQVGVNAQKMAECRWLNNMVHDPVAMSEFLEQRKSKQAN